MDILNLTLVAILIALTGFFVATEFAMVKVRMTRINQLIEEGKPGAIAAKKVVTHLDEYLSACQLGITITALGLGALAEPTVERLLHPVFDSMNLDPTWSSVLSYIIAFASVTFLHVVVGELAPKTVAIQKAETITLLFAKPIIWFYRIMFPAIWLLNGSAGLLVKMFGLKQASEHEVSHSEEELRMILSDSYKSGEINQTELTYVNNIFEFDNRIAKEIMVPRTSIIAVSIDDTLGDVLDLMDAEKYTRYPVVDGDKDNILGIINVKDMMKAQRKYAITDCPMRELMKPVISIIETIPINELLLKMQKERTHMAVLYDEYGGTSGIVTVEDILEEIVGEIQDEYDTDEVEDIRKIKENHYLVSSMVLIEDVNDLLGTHLSEEEVDTIGGWILTRKYEVEVGDIIEEEGFEFTIKEMDGHQILFIDVKKV
ncbi:hemolysin family protein [Bacillus massiliigorillae]|uniref:hemolysin family protein n=1 Tax=Bacillus massiliigorillae TaxID=1243664 RepID=UPI0005A5F504|nr:hemolysin family protein [Bacillus massiliigorillae]